MESVNELLDSEVGELITLSSIQMLEDYKEMEVDFIIEDIRRYKEPNDSFSYMGYVLQCSRNEELKYMLLIRQVGDVSDQILFYLQFEGTVREARSIVITEDGEDLKSRFSTSLMDAAENELEIVWDRIGNGSFHGVSVRTVTESFEKTIAGYFTDDVCGDNPHGMLEWAGDLEDGWCEFWTGHEISFQEVKVYNESR